MRWAEEHGQLNWQGWLGLVVVCVGVLYLPELWGSTSQLRYGRLILLPLVLVYGFTVTYVRYRRARRSHQESP